MFFYLNRILVLVITGLLLTAPAMAAQAPLPDFKTQYSVSRAGIKLAETRFMLTKQQDGSYYYESFGEPAGLIAWMPGAEAKERSHWIWQNDRIRSLDYQYEIDDGGEDSHNLKADFDWDNHKVTITRKGRTYGFDLPDDAMDRMVVQLAVMIDLKRGRQPLDYTVVERKRIHHFKFRDRGREPVETVLGTFNTIKIESLPGKPDEPRRTIFWVAPELNYLSVKVEQSKRGSSTYTMVITDIEGMTSPTIERTRAANKKRDKEASESIGW